MKIIDKMCKVLQKDKDRIISPACNLNTCTYRLTVSGRTVVDSRVSGVDSRVSG